CARSFSEAVKRARSPNSFSISIRRSTSSSWGQNDGMTDDRIRRADDFLALTRRESATGKLKVYLGMAAGVGKTVRMLDDHPALRQQGVDIVVGYVETHGRVETAARIADLEVIPRATIHYKDV